MSGQWKPGDVALVRISADFPPEVAVSGDRQWFVAGPRLGSQHGWHHDRVEVIRPLVVIDPEDREQVERLISSLLGMSFSPWACGAFTCMQAALREFANRKPPRPDEPRGLGAVVEDEAGDAWVLDRDDNLGYLDVRWLNVRTRAHRRYAEIDAVEVLSEGVTP